MEENEERPSTQQLDEAPASSIPSLNAILNTSSGNQQILLLQQGQQQSTQQQMVSLMGAQSTPAIKQELTSVSSTLTPPLISSSAQPSVNTTTNNMSEYVIPSNLLQTTGGGLIHVPVMSQQDNSDQEVGVHYEDPNRDRDELREQDRFLPIANVARIMKRAIPETGKIAKDAKECVQECVSEFISFITSEASDRCHQEKRKTINGEDILFAMTTLGFDNYVEPLKLYLTKYRESIKGEKVLNVTEYGQVDVEETDASTMQHTLQYQVGSALHPSMVSSDGTYAYTQAQVTQLQNMQFNG